MTRRQWTGGVIISSNARPNHDIHMTQASFRFESLPNPGAGTPEARQRYVQDHAPRFYATVEQCVALRPDKSASVLDIGRSHLSAALLDYYDRISTLGLNLDMTQNYAHSAGWEPPPGKHYGEHIVCDLNAIATPCIPQAEKRFDLIVFAEVIEHLYAAPETVLAWLRELLEKDGLILCTTPNAASLPKRVKLFFGYNPFERLRGDLNNPGHIREYTRAELFELGRLAGLDVIMHRYLNYGTPQRRPSVKTVAKLLSRTLSGPCPSLSDFQMIVFRRR